MQKKCPASTLTSHIVSINIHLPFNQAKRCLTAEQSYRLTNTLGLLHLWLSRDFHVRDLHTPPQIGEGNAIQNILAQGLPHDKYSDNMLNIFTIFGLEGSKLAYYFLNLFPNNCFQLASLPIKICSICCVFLS